MKNIKNESGITLVALVITIIILLILAGASIALVVSEGGILGKATNAVSTNEKATAIQEIKLSIADCQMAFYDQWVTNKNVHRGKYYGSSAQETYQANCSSGEVEVTNADSIGDDSDAGVIKIQYTTKSQKVLKFSFNLTEPDKLYEGETGSGTQV